MTSPKRKKIEECKDDSDIEADISKILVEDCDLDITILLRLRNHLQNSKDNVSLHLFLPLNLIVLLNQREC